MTITSQDLPKILGDHLKWMRSEPGGSRADLSWANLSMADLSGANLYGADLSGANLYGADLYGANVAKGSKVAAVWPIGDSDRQCIGVIAQADGAHKKPFLWLVCGCFSGDEKAYRARISKRYSKKSAHYKQCLAALVAIKALASTWEIEK
jgi:hypothetical protein